jgi:hypothetical protein
MILQLMQGYPDFMGLRKAFAGYGSGPSSYSPTTGDVLTLSDPRVYIDAVFGGVMSVSGNYYVRSQVVTAVGERQSWTLHWFNAPVQSGISGAAFTAGSGYPNRTVVLPAGSGGASITVVISGGAITSAYVSNPGNGYVTLPTFSLAPIEGVVVVQNAAGIGMTAPSGTQAPMTFSGGNGTGAAGYITVTGATTCTITITNPGTGYTTAGTATVSNTITGGTAPTLTVSVGTGAAVSATGLGPSDGIEVAVSTNLSAEQVQIGGFCGQY